MAASVLAFIASSVLINETAKDIVATIVGSISVVVVFLQTMSGDCNYGTRAAMHSSAAIDLRDLRDEIVLIKFKVKIEEEQGIERGHCGDDESTRASFKYNKPPIFENDSDSSDSEDEEMAKEVKEHENVFNRIQQRYRQSLPGVPMGLSEAFKGMHSNLLVSESFDNNMYMRDIYGPYTNHKNITHFKAFDILSSEILNSALFPLKLPNFQKVVDQAMTRLNSELNKDYQYWDEKLDLARKVAIEEARAMKNPDLPWHLRQSQLLSDSSDRLSQAS